MRRITLDDEVRIFKDLIEGLNYREIARKEDVSLATVNRVVSDQRQKISDFDDIRKLAVRLRKLGLTLFDVKKASDLVDQLSKNDVKLEELEDFISLVNHILSEKNVDASFIDSALKLMKMEAETGKDPDHIIHDLEKALKRTKELSNRACQSSNRLQKTNNQIKEAQTKLKQLRANIQQKIQAQKNLKEMGSEKMNRLASFTKDYESLGFNAQVVRKLAKWKQQIQKLGIDPEKLGEWIAERGPLQNQNQLLKLGNGSLIKEGNRQARFTQAITRRNSTLKQVEQILRTRTLAMYCKGCDAQISTALKTKEELEKMIRENLAVFYYCSNCGLTQPFTAWDMLVQIGFIVVPKSGNLEITIENPT
jgi:hypothetical protein